MISLQFIISRSNNNNKIVLGARFIYNYVQSNKSSIEMLRIPYWSAFSVLLEHFNRIFEFCRRNLNKNIVWWLSSRNLLIFCAIYLFRAYSFVCWIVLMSSIHLIVIIKNVDSYKYVTNVSAEDNETISSRSIQPLHGFVCFVNVFNELFA